MKQKAGLSLAIAGHVDHGKTSLVKNLTGKDTDRLKEEKERGLSINISFAFLNFKEFTVGLIDLPGHNKFINNMISGAHSLSGAIIVVAADDGIMPQTEEHINIFKLLGVTNFFVVISKIDLVTEQRLFEVENQILSYSKEKGIEIFEVFKISNKNNDKISELTKRIFKFCSSISLKPNYSDFRLDIDRAFEIKGRGTIVTGTCKNNSIKIGDDVVLYPKNIEFKIKELQTNQKDVEICYSGERTAIKIPNLNWKEIKRGEIIAVKNSLINTKIIDVVLNWTSEFDFKNNSEVKIYCGCKILIGKIKFLKNIDDINFDEKVFAQIYLNENWYFNKNELALLKTLSDDSINKGIKIIRQGRTVLKKDKQDYFKELIVLTSGDVYSRTVLQIKLDPEKIVDSKKLYCELCIDDFRNDPELITYRDYVAHRSVYNFLSKKILKALESSHLKKPLSPGLTFSTLYTFVESDLEKDLAKILLLMMQNENLIKVDKALFSLKKFEVILSEEQTRLKNFILKRLKQSGLKLKEINSIKEKVENQKSFEQMLKYLVDIKSVVMIDFDHYITTTSYKEIIDRVKNHIKIHNSINNKEFSLMFNIDDNQTKIIIEKLKNDRILQKENDNWVKTILWDI